MAYILFMMLDALGFVASSCWRGALPFERLHLVLFILFKVNRLLLLKLWVLKLFVDRYQFTIFQVASPPLFFSSLKAGIIVSLPMGGLDYPLWSHLTFRSWFGPKNL